jgi:putative ABC transport system permease protein
MADMAIDLRPGADVDEVRDRLSAATGLTIGQFDPPGVIADYRRVRGAAWLVAGLLGILVVITVVNLVAVTLNRRGRDIAVLRSLGADRRWVSRVEHWHALAVGLAVGLVGAALGVGLGRTLFRWRVTERIGATDEAALPILAVGLGVVALVVLADVVAQVAIRWRRGGVARRLATE